MAVLSVRRGAVGGLVVALAATGTLTAAHAAPANLLAEPCAAAYEGELTEGQEVHGLTVVRGSTPVTFTGTYLDTVPNGIARDRDMLIFQLEGPRITDADGNLDAGIWAGMSGSPVYDTATGDLIGAVSYGRTVSNDVLAGVTPAADMYDVLLSGERPTSTGAETVPVGQAARAARRAGVAANTTTRLQRIVAPRQFSGVSQRAASVFAKKGGFGGPVSTGVGARAAAPEIPLVAGGNVAVSWSYGDITAASVGTVTAICGDEVLAFGHPDVYSGTSTQTMHGARALGIAANGGFQSFKDVAEIGGPVGRLTQDRIEGIAGTLGKTAPTVPVTTTTTVDGRTVKGATMVTELDEMAMIIAMQLNSDTISAFNQDEPGGESSMSWAIDYTRANGAKHTLRRTQRYSERSMLDYAVTEDVASDVYALLENDFEDVKVTGVRVSNRLTSTYRALRIAKVEMRRDGKWRQVRNGGTITAQAGRRIGLRVSLVPADRHSKAKATTRTLSPLLAKSARSYGELVLFGNRSSFDEEYYYEDYEEYYYGDDEYGFDFDLDVEPRNFAEFVRYLAAQPRQDDLQSVLAYRHTWKGGGTAVSQSKVRLPSVTQGVFYADLRISRR